MLSRTPLTPAQQLEVSGRALQLAEHDLEQAEKAVREAEAKAQDALEREARRIAQQGATMEARSRLDDARLALDMQRARTEAARQAHRQAEIAAAEFDFRGAERDAKRLETVGQRELAERLDAAFAEVRACLDALDEYNAQGARLMAAKREAWRRAGRGDRKWHWGRRRLILNRRLKRRLLAVLELGQLRSPRNAAGIEIR